jgi:hypothetical protein
MDCFLCAGYSFPQVRRAAGQRDAEMRKPCVEAGDGDLFRQEIEAVAQPFLPADLDRGGAGGQRRALSNWR